MWVGEEWEIKRAVGIVLYASEHRMGVAVRVSRRAKVVGNVDAKMGMPKMSGSVPRLTGDGQNFSGGEVSCCATIHERNQSKYKTKKIENSTEVIERLTERRRTRK